MKVPTYFDIGNRFLQGIKIGFGSALAIFIAETFQLEFVTSSGIITLLTITETKKESFQLCLERLLTFIITISVSWLVFENIERNWVSYGIVIVAITFIISQIRMLSTLSVNAVVVTHLLIKPVIDLSVLLNELWLLIIGITIALMVNHVHDYQNQRECLEICIEQTEEEFQKILSKLVSYLTKNDENHVWADICELEKTLESFRLLAFQYQENRLPKKDDYFLKYFQMRTQQCGILHNLHYELRKIQDFDSESKVIANYFQYIKKYLDESNHPVEQLACLRELINNIPKQQRIESPEEFFSKARLYHILMNIEEFLTFKERFIISIEQESKSI